MVAFLLVFGLPVDTEMWVGSCRAITSAGESGEILLKCAQCWVFETLQLVLYEQTTKVIWEYRIFTATYSRTSMATTKGR